MIDIHSHVLPKMDDGSNDKEESVLMLQEAYRQGVEIIFSTPHFYPERDDPEEFFHRRNRSLRSLRSTEADVLNSLPICLGAEVAFFYGMSRFEHLKDFSLGGSEYILIEMPFARWTREEVEEIIAVKEVAGLIPVLAHVERYLPFGNKRFLKYFVSQNVLLQVNAEFFINKKSRHKAMKMLKKGYISFLGSDCHNIKNRPENYGQAVEIINKSSKKEYFSNIIDNEKAILSKNLKIF